MKIKQITIQNFTVHADTRIDLDKPVALFLGPQESGKSSIAEAVSLVVAGRSMRLPKVKDLPWLIADGAKSAILGITAEPGGPHLVKITSAISSLPGMGAGDPAVVAAVFESRRILAMEPEQRRDLVAKVLKVNDTAKIQELLEKRGFGHYAAIDREWPNLKRAGDAAVAIRQGLKRQIDNVSAPRSNPNPQVTIAGPNGEPKRFDLDNVTMEGIRSTRAALESELTKIKGIFHVQEEAKRLASEKKIHDDWFASHPSRANELKGLESTRDDLLKQRDDALAQVLKYRMMLTSATMAGHQCPVLGTKCKELAKGVPVEEWKSTLEKNDSIAKDCEEGARRASEQIQEINNAESHRKHHEEKSAELDASRAAVALNLPKDWSRDDPVMLCDIETLEGRIRTGDILMSHKMKYDNEKEAHLSGIRANDQIETLENEVRKIDAVAKYIEGDLSKELLAGALDPLRKRIEETSRILPGHSVQVTDDLDLLLDGRPMEVLSESERFRVGFLVQEAISWFSGMKLLVVDRLEMLRGMYQQEFMREISELADGYDTILLFATATEAPKAGPENFSIFWVDKGKVSRVL